ncbi:MAG: DUF1569 domain-containing protein [Flavobacterium sp.]|nr:DUF1569 domain-containing protein [Flavobacterium sp.]
MTRLEALEETANRNWGTMSHAQMLAHCQKPLDVANENLVIKRSIVSYLFGSMMKKKLIDKGEDFKKNLPTVKEFKITSELNFEIEKAISKAKIYELGQKREVVIKVKTHPFFGKMSQVEWGVLLYKHLDHHFKQFGI